MINLDSIANKNNKKHNEKWPYITNNPHRILIIDDSGSRKTNALLNLINEQDDALNSAKNLFLTREKINNAFKKGIFLYIDGFQVEKEPDEKSKLEFEEIDTTNMPGLEKEESASERRNQQGKGFKILTLNQMLSRLPISLAQLKAGNNSEKLKNEIRQLLCSLYRSKKLTKQI